MCRALRWNLPPRRVRRETLAYEHGHSNALWHADFHWARFGITTKKGEVVQPRLLAILDDHSRIYAHAQWYLGETAELFVHGLSQAFMKLGLPRSLMTDNGSPMIAGEVAQKLRDLGVAFAGIPPRTYQYNILNSFIFPFPSFSFFSFSFSFSFFLGLALH